MGTTFLGLAMYENHKGCGAHHQGDSCVGQGQTVLAEPSERHVSDIAASFAKPTCPQVTPSSQFDHIHADGNGSQK
jgi:hypothetical protein